MSFWNKWFVGMVVVALLGLITAGCAPAPAPPAEEVPEEVTEAPAEEVTEEVVEEELTGSSADRAVQAAQKYRGTTITVNWEAGLQAQDPLVFAPKWEELTGIKVNIVELAYTDLHDVAMAEHLAKSGAFDVLNVSPAWFGDFVSVGVIDPIGEYIEKYMNKEDLDDFHPVYKEAFQYWGGKQYGVADDGDVFILYYRKDLFEDPANQEEFKAKYGYDLAPPKTWKEFAEISAFFTDKYAPNLYGAAIQRLEGQAYSWFVGHFVGNGGQFFDPETMESGINQEAGIKTLEELVEQNKYMPPGIAKWGFMEVLSAWLDGKVAMITTWPPIGRWSEGYGTQTKQLEWVPKTTVAGKVGYAVVPGGRPTLAGGFALSISSDSKNKDAAYLFIQWMTSPEISLQRVMLPFALRDPYRLSHFESPLYRSAWEGAGEYLDVLNQSANQGQLELGIPGAREYLDTLDHALTAAYGGTDPKQALDEAAAKWEEITDRLGRDSQKQAYADWLKQTGAQP